LPQVRSLLALLVQKVQKLTQLRGGTRVAAGTQFTCFTTGTKVQILTQLRRDALPQGWGGMKLKDRRAALQAQADAFLLAGVCAWSRHYIS
jgi:predicted amino acid racemase